MLTFIAFAISFVFGALYYVSYLRGVYFIPRLDRTPVYMVLATYVFMAAVLALFFLIPSLDIVLVLGAFAGAILAGLGLTVRFTLAYAKLGNKD
jgi:hypothetical protein